MKSKEYNQHEQQIIDMLTPKVELKPSAELKTRVLEAAANQQKVAAKKPARVTYWLRGAVSVAAVVAIAFTLTLTSPVTASRRYFSNAIEAASRVKSMILELNVRTEPYETMEFVSPKCAMLPVTIKAIYDEPMLWCAEKQGGRVAFYKGANEDGNKVYQWIQGAGEGWATNYNGFVNEELALFLNPQLLLDFELRATKERNKAKYTKYEITEIGEWVNVKISSTAQGYYADSDYMLNTSLAEAKTIREYSFNKKSGHLLKVRIDMVMPNREVVTVVESGLIVYDEPLTAENLVAADYSQVEFITPEPPSTPSSQLVGISADKAAKIILGAMGEWNEEVLGESLWSLTTDMVENVKARYGGLKLLSVGKPFRSGLYPGRFVKCKVVLADGEKCELVLALRNDNKAKAWVLDGGL